MLRYIYFGTPEISANVLDSLSKNYNPPIAIITAVDKKSGRGMKLTASPVKEWALNNNVQIFQPEKLKDIQAELTNIKADIGILFAYGKIIPQWLMDLFPHGIINVHPSLLPLYRGPSPIEAPLLNSDTTTGITIMQLDSGIDTGEIILQKEIKLSNEDTAEDIKKFIIEEAPGMLIKTLDFAEEDRIVKYIQDGSMATYTRKWEKTDGEIKEDDTEIQKWNKYRAFNSSFGVYFLKNESGINKRYKITLAEYKHNKFNILKVIPENGREIEYKEDN